MASYENMPPAVMRRVMKELQEMSKSPLEDIRVIPNEEDVSELVAEISGPSGTPFEGGVFKIKLCLGADFPAAPPKGFFVTKIFHPNVAPKTGEICVNTLKKDWKSDMGFKHVLMVIRCLLIEPNPESALNEEAGRLLLENYADYAKHSRMMTSIHAMPAKEGVESPSVEAESEAPSESSSAAEAAGSKSPMKKVAAASAAAKPASVAASKAAADKKRSLKRL